MSEQHEKRRALRINLNAPTRIEVIGQPSVNLHANLEKVYERVSANGDMNGERFPGIVRDLSTNGAFVSGKAVPLMSRLAFSFPLEGFGQVEVLGWSLWRRTEDCEVPGKSGETVLLPPGFGVLFEAIPLDARIAIHDAVSK